jgi:competence ComEA-like helix-hairpin-helix protein
MEKKQRSLQADEPGKDNLLDRLRLALWSDHQGLIATLLLVVLLTASVYFVAQWNASKGLVDIDEVAGSEFLFQVDLNTSNVGELMLLPGVGPKLSQSILLHRKEFGRFKHHAELLMVPGIGEKKYRSIRPFLSPLKNL